MFKNKTYIGHDIGIAVGIIMVLLLLVGGAGAATLTVCQGGCTYSNIQAAIDAASSGDTVIVHSGTYYENVNVNKRLTLKGIDTGGGKPVINSSLNATNFLIADWSTIERFTIISIGAGIIVKSNNSIIKNNTVFNSGDGIRLEFSKNNVIIDNIVSNNSKIGISLASSNDNKLINNIALNNGYGIRLSNSINNMLSSNTANLNNESGIELASSNNNTLKDNNALNNRVGIHLSHSSNNNILSGNKMSDNEYNFGVDYPYNDNIITNMNHSIDTSNMVNGKPIYYLQGVSDKEYDSKINAGTFYCINCNNITVKDLNLTNNMFGLIFSGTNNSKIENINTSSNVFGIFLVRSSNNNILNGNIANSNYNFGIGLDYSNNNTLNGNIANSNYNFGTYIWYSNNNMLSSNNASNSGRFGIGLGYSNNNTFSSNKIYNNVYGIVLLNSNSTIIYNNIFNNTNNSAILNSVTRWNITRTNDTNIIGGPYIGGNFWAYPNGTGFSQTCSDADNDGICDSPYALDSNNTDYLPLSYKSIVTPTPTLTVSPQSGKQGTIFQYSGNNYTPNGTIDWHVLKPDGTEYPIGSLTADSSGNLSYQYSSSCNSMVGSYTIWAIDGTTGKKSNNVTQTISASPSCTGQSSTILGIDISASVVSQQTFEKLKSDRNYQFAIIESWTPKLGNIKGKLPMTKDNLKNARMAGLKTASYILIDFNTDINKQMKEAIDNIGEEKKYIYFMGIDLEQSFSKDQKNKAVDMIHKAIDILKSQGIKPVIYTRKGYWNTYFNGIKEFSNIPLWDTTWDLNPDLETNWVSYGGWQIRTGKQYASDRSKEAQVIFKNYQIVADLDSFDSSIFGIITPTPHQNFAKPVHRDSLHYQSCPGTGQKMVWSGKYDGYDSTRCEDTGGHTGVDISPTASKTSEPIYAIGKGTVVHAGSDKPLSGWGNYVTIKHEHISYPAHDSIPGCNDCTIYSFYDHLASIDVKVGQTVDRDQKIGMMGKSEGNWPIHLHFQIQSTEKQYWSTYTGSNGKQVKYPAGCNKDQTSCADGKLTEAQRQEAAANVRSHTINPLWLVENGYYIN